MVGVEAGRQEMARQAEQAAALVAEGQKEQERLVKALMVEMADLHLALMLPLVAVVGVGPLPILRPIKGLTEQAVSAGMVVAELRILAHFMLAAVAAASTLCLTLEL